MPNSQHSNQYTNFGFIELKKGRICATVCDVYKNIIKRINEAKSFTTLSPNQSFRKEGSLFLLLYFKRLGESAKKRLDNIGKLYQQSAGSWYADSD